MSGVIPKEQLAAFSRWQIKDFDAKPKRVVTPAPPPPRPSETPSEAPSPAQPVETVTQPVNLPTADEIEQIYEEARQAGHAAGLAEARKESAELLQAERDREMARLGELTANFSTALESLEQAVAEQVLELALAVAGRVLLVEVQQRRDLLLPVIREALLALPVHHGNIALHAHPDDIANLQDSLSEISGQGIHLVSDSTMQAGGCLLKAGQSEIDVSLATRWQRVLEAIGVDAGNHPLP